MATEIPVVGQVVNYRLSADSPFAGEVRAAIVTGVTVIDNGDDPDTYEVNLKLFPDVHDPVQNPPAVPGGAPLAEKLWGVPYTYAEDGDYEGVQPGGCYPYEEPQPLPDP